MNAKASKARPRQNVRHPRSAAKGPLDHAATLDACRINGFTSESFFGQCIRYR